MKKIITSILLALVAFSMSAQSLYINLGADTRVFAEKTAIDEHSTTFGYIEWGTGYTAPYMQLFRERTIVGGLAFHYEIRTDFGVSSDVLLNGLTYTFAGDKGYLSTSVLARDERHIGWACQLGQAWSVTLCDRLEFGGYSDEWWRDGFNLYTECRLHIAVSDKIGIGAIVDVIGGQEWLAIPRFSLRYNL